MRDTKHISDRQSLNDGVEFSTGDHVAGVFIGAFVFVFVAALVIGLVVNVNM